MEIASAQSLRADIRIVYMSGYLEYNRGSGEFAIAETAIYDRLRRLEIEPRTIDERRAIGDALARLRVL